MRIHSSPSAPRWRWLVLLPALGCLSCSAGTDLHPTQGTVRYKNEPLKGAVVTFHPKGAAANDVSVICPIGLAKEDGTFTLTTGPNEGAPAGAYVVTVICPEPVGSKDKQAFSTGPPETQDRLRGAYADRAKSTFEVEIKKGANRLDPFELK